jgi:hypothetical protein
MIALLFEVDFHNKELAKCTYLRGCHLKHKGSKLNKLYKNLCLSSPFVEKVPNHPTIKKKHCGTTPNYPASMRGS